MTRLVFWDIQQQAKTGCFRSGSRSHGLANTRPEFFAHEYKPSADCQSSARRGLSIAPEVLEPIGRQLGVAYRTLHAPVAEIMLKGAGIDAVVGELEPAGMAQHVRVHGERQLGGLAGPLDYFFESYPDH